MPGADVAVAQLQSFPQRELQALLGWRRERDVAARRPLAPADEFFDVAPDRLQGDAGGRQRLRGGTLVFTQQTKQQMLGADVGMVEAPGLFLGRDDGVPRLVSESLEHGDPPDSCRTPRG